MSIYWLLLGITAIIAYLFGSMEYQRRKSFSSAPMRR